MSIDQTTRRGTREVMSDPTTTVRVSDGDELDVWVRGEGTPVVFIHGVLTRDLLLPTMDDLSRTGHHQVIHYGRRGHGGRGLPAEPTDVAGQVPDVIAILDALGIDRAHVVGHSFGAFIALDLAMQAAGRVRSAILLEPVFAQHLRSDASAHDTRELGELVPRLAQAYSEGDPEAAVTMLWQFTSGLRDTGVIDTVLPADARRLSAADMGTCLQVDLPAMGSWTVDPAAMQEVAAPLRWLGGADSAAGFAESCALFREWLPEADVALIEGAGHFFPALAAAETAAIIDRWLTGTTPVHGG